MNVNCSDKVKIDPVTAGGHAERARQFTKIRVCSVHLFVGAFSSVSLGIRPTKELCSLPPGPRMSLGTGGCLVSVHAWLTGPHKHSGHQAPEGKPVTTTSHDSKSNLAPKATPGLPASGAPMSSPWEPASAPLLQCLFLPSAHSWTSSSQGLGLPKGTNSDSGLLGAEGSAWQTSGAQKPSANLLVSWKLGLLQARTREVISSRCFNQGKIGPGY